MMERLIRRPAIRRWNEPIAPRASVRSGAMHRLRPRHVGIAILIAALLMFPAALMFATFAAAGSASCDAGTATRACCIEYAQDDMAAAACDQIAP